MDLLHLNNLKNDDYTKEYRQRRQFKEAQSPKEKKKKKKKMQQRLIFKMGGEIIHTSLKNYLLLSSASL